MSEAEYRVERMAHDFDAKLVLPYGEVVDVRSAERNVVVELVVAAVIRERHHALFRQGTVKFKLPEFHIEPGGVLDVVDANVGGFESGRAINGIKGGYEQERNILSQGARGQKINAGEIESGRFDGLFDLTIAGID